MSNFKLVASALGATFLLSACAGLPSTSDSPPSTPTQAADGTLIGPNGKTLYFFANDVPNSGASTCYDACAVNWPPLEVAQTETVKPLGPYTIIQRTDGLQQWAFDGKPLYYFIGDKSVGDRNGDGVKGVWQIAR